MLKLLVVFSAFVHAAIGSACYGSGFLSWSAWGACSKPCAGGFKLRHCTYDGSYERERCNTFCHSTGEYYSGACHCPPGTTGECCTDIQECESGPCKNHGVCQEYKLNTYTCLCPPGTVQPNCDDISECYSNPCKNGGTCHEDNLDEYECICPPGTTGVNCDDILECNSNPCMNGGTCMEHINGYTCACVLGTTGPNCEDIRECDSSPCQNNGNCTDLINMYMCTCPPRYAGSNCEKVRYRDPIFWIGGQKSGTSSPHWVSGHRVQTSRWPFGVTNNVIGTQCITMDGTYNFEWNVFSCDRMSYFICEETTLFNINVG